MDLKVLLAQWEQVNKEQELLITPPSKRRVTKKHVVKKPVSKKPKIKNRKRYEVNYIKLSSPLSFPHHQQPITKNMETEARKLYREEVWRLTELNDLSVLKHHDKRGFNNYHLDHIIPLKYGWKHQLPPEYIANIRNLRFIPWRDNLKKGFQLTSKAKHLLESHPPRSI